MQEGEHVSRRRCDIGRLRLLTLGSAIVAFAMGFVLSGWRATSWSDPRRDMGSTLQLAEAAPAMSRRAYVMMAYDPPGEEISDALWGAIAVAQSLKQFTKHRIVLLTNHKVFDNGDSVAEAFHRLGVETRTAHALPLPRVESVASKFYYSEFKLQAWNLTEFDDLIWLDTDSLVFRDIDYLFDRQGLWMARDDWLCHMSQPTPNSGIIKFKPSKSTYDGLVEHMRSHSTATVHEVIASYHMHRLASPVNLLADIEAAFGRCANHQAPSPYLSESKPTNGLYSQVAFVHKSGGIGAGDDGIHDNACFQHFTKRQIIRKGKTLLNVCHFHPLAPIWRARFCEGAVKLMGLGPILSIGSFCHDRCYYGGVAIPGLECEHGIVATPDINEYWARVGGDMILG